MVHQLISHPFRVLSNGSVATSDQGGTDSNMEQIAMFIMTIRGERVMVPEFGLRDATFGVIEPGEISTGVHIYGPPDVSIDTVDVLPTTNEGVVSVVVTADV